MNNPSPQTIWETYTRAWSEIDTKAQQDLFHISLHPDCVYTDPFTQATGYAVLSGYMAELQKNVPGAHFITTDFKSHDGGSLAHWNMADAAGNILAPGASYGRYGADGRLVQMAGFYQPPSAG